jgi:phenylpyruvate tautomerase PptA (4-oxalocrotonate tautomerase family)
VPFLQLDVPGPLTMAQKRHLAEALGACYAETMQTQRHIPSIAVRCNDGGPWRWEEGALHEVAVLMCDVRRGRSSEHRARAMHTLATLVADELGIDPLRVVVEFTQHDHDEMFRYGRIAEAWTVAEAE